MCTVVAIRSAKGVRIAGNRDELRTRAEAIPPQVYETQGIHWLAPRDPDGQGTWMAVSERGLALVLLNDYQSQPSHAQPPFRSRGLIVQDLVMAQDLADLAGMLLRAGDTLRHTRPFELLAATLQGALHVHWDGDDLRVRPVEFPAVLTSSVQEPQRTQRAREAELTMLLGDPADVAVQHAALQQWFSRHQPGDAPRPICLHHDLAATVSHTQVEITSDHVQMRYHPAAPCQPAQAVELVLPRS